MSLNGLTVSEMREGLLKKDFTATELVKSHLDRIEKTNPEFNSFITLAKDSALAQAKEADGKLAKYGEEAPLLTGIPLAIKDMLCTDGIKTTCASKILGDFIPPYDCTAVAKLKAAGGIVLGKTNLDEFAMGSSNEYSAFGPVKNPWDKSRVPGGSSGGSAVSVALGQAPISLGTDTGGSIRQPASLCGVVGMKPTYGRVSRYGAVAFASSLDQIGPFARNVTDAALALETISGYDEQDSTSHDIPPLKLYEEIKTLGSSRLDGLRLGVPKEYFIDGMDKEVEANARECLKLLEKLGAKIVDISLPHTKYALPVYYIVAPAEAASNLARFDGVRYGYRSTDGENLIEMYEKTRANGFGAEVKRRILIGNYVLSAGYYDAFYLKGQQVRTLVINDFKAAFNNHCDLIVTPVSPTTAFKIGETTDPLSMYLADIFTVPTNLAGLPGISVPSGLDSKKLPIGLQFIAPAFAELEMFKAAKVFESEIGFNNRHITEIN